ncbi:hypothetical protein ZIOFF_061950 [Zingiber officinale]|uniref:Uncharacterized protein n=1 Tax=Zingiber officinale TaxID=94328 RepID=A0A8J5EZQ5_ZINOF|nr:hypothetical protein ZIOFF_061950 [Zingiber officinale]
MENRIPTTEGVESSPLGSPASSPLNSRSSSSSSLQEYFDETSPAKPRASCLCPIASSLPLYPLPIRRVSIVPAQSHHNELWADCYSQHPPLLWIFFDSCPSTVANFISFPLVAGGLGVLVWEMNRILEFLAVDWGYEIEEKEGDVVSNCLLFCEGDLEFQQHETHW